MTIATTAILSEGTISFAVEPRLLRELGERLVKTREVALIELVKNSYDADAPSCDIRLSDNEIVVRDTGTGIPFAVFEEGWMRIGTAYKTRSDRSVRYGRPVTGEKGIGRFATRFLGGMLRLDSVADDPERGMRTRLTATFDWPLQDSAATLADVTVPFRLEAVDNSIECGTVLTISDLREPARSIKTAQVATATLGMISPIASLLPSPVKSGKGEQDPGFQVHISGGEAADVSADLAERVLRAAPVLASLKVRRGKGRLIARTSDNRTSLKIKIDLVDCDVDVVDAELRYFPNRKGVFTALGVDGRRAKAWVKENAGVSVFDRGFRVLPYGTRDDDWLKLSFDRARSLRRPRSSIALQHFPVPEQVVNVPKDNYMLFLPGLTQLIGVVGVRSARTSTASEIARLVPAADREGFLDNAAFRQLQDLVRACTEAVAYVDFEDRKKQMEVDQKELTRKLRADARRAVKILEQNRSIARRDREKLIRIIESTSLRAEQLDLTAQRSARMLEVMSLLGVAAGFMTHEFGEARAALVGGREIMQRSVKKLPELSSAVSSIDAHLAKLQEFHQFVRAYVDGTKEAPDSPYPARPRALHVCQLFGDYAKTRSITLANEIDRALQAPPVPPALYTGVLLNLVSNSLKAIARSQGPRSHQVAIRAWEQGRWHVLQVSDTGIGIPDFVRERVFEPLFTTTDRSRDPLGSGMGLGLTIVKRAVESFGGHAEVVSAPSGFATCLQIRLPLRRGNST